MQPSDEGRSATLGSRWWLRLVAAARALPRVPASGFKALLAVDWRTAIRRTPGAVVALPRHLRRGLGSFSWATARARPRQAAVDLLSWWRGLGRSRRYALVAASFVAVLGIPLGVFIWSGVSAALEARDAYRELQAEMSHMTPVDLVQVNVYHSLEGKFEEAEQAVSRARSRLGFLRALQWVPVLGGRIEEGRNLLEMGFYQGRAGRDMATVYRSAIASVSEESGPEEASEHIARVLRESAPKLASVSSDLRRVADLRDRLGATERGARYGVLVDRYLPALQTVAYLSRTDPRIIGHTYVLSRELTSLQELASDPLDVIANPEDVGRALETITEQATAVESAFELVRRATEMSTLEDPKEMAAVRDILEIVVPGVILLRHVTAGTRSLVAIAEEIESTGFLSKEFGLVAEVTLDDAIRELTLARKEVSSLQELLSVRDSEADSFLPSPVLGGVSGLSATSTERVEVLLDEAISATGFLRSFLGLDGARTYLLIGQNQNEIRATGGFIGIAVQVTVDRGQLTELVYQNSTTVDRTPLIDNPEPPEGLFWYLWMGRLLFRDANWNPHFPSSAAKVADLYSLGMGVHVDGVITRNTAVAYAEGDFLYQCEPRHNSVRPERCFDEDLFIALKNRLTSKIAPSLRRELVGVVKDHLDLKNILVHIFPPDDDSFLWERGWNGAVSLVDHDYLMVIDSSLPGHSAKRIERAWEYDLPPIVVPQVMRHW